MISAFKRAARLIPCCAVSVVLLAARASGNAGGSGVTVSDPSRMTKSGFLSDYARLATIAGADGIQCWRDPGTFNVGATDKSGRDFRAKGRLAYVGGHYLQFAGTKEYFLKAGSDAPENFLAYREFDGDFAKDGHKDNLVKDWKPHVQDWKTGDPTWQNGKGKGIIGAVNYLAGKGANAVSFLTMNIGGDDQNVFPYVAYTDYAHLDVSRLEQWEIVLAHAKKLGLFLHFKTQEAENQGLLDGGETGPQRKLYYRELVARFGHHLALNWNMGEEIGPTVPGSSVDGAEIDRLKDRVQQFGERQNFLEAQQLTIGQIENQLSAKITELQAQIAQPPAMGANAEVNALRADLAALTQRLAQAEASAARESAPGDERLAEEQIALIVHEQTAALKTQLLEQLQKQTCRL